MSKYCIGLLGFMLFQLSCKNVQESSTSRSDTSTDVQPNIVIFYVDDLGYGDLGVYGAQGVNTPNVDKLAANGVVFTDAHSTSATCTPSRYSLLTGQYAFRNNASVLPGDAPLIIDPGLETLPKMLKRTGYRTGVVGKWHLGLGNGDVDWNTTIKPGPFETGFDYSFLIPATGDRVPSVYLENDRVVGLSKSEAPLEVNYSRKIGNFPDGIQNPELLRQPADPEHSNTVVNGISRIGFMTGGASAYWNDEDFADVLTAKADTFISEKAEEPFFLFFSFHDIHVPRLPHPRFQGKSTMGPRGDAIVQMDWITGKVIESLRQRNLLENTLIIFTSDNGPVLNDGYEDQAVELLGEHKPGGIYRGGKYSAFEAGTRVPTIVYWEGKAIPGVNEALISQVDFYASLANLTASPLKKGEAIDSKNLSDVLLGRSIDGRSVLVEESFTLALRNKNWKFIDALPRKKNLPTFIARKGIEDGASYKMQLYDINTDPSEKVNVAQDHPELVNRFKNQLDSIRNLKSILARKVASDS
ncbi:MULTISPECIES: arylsulfatase [unclassified Leeuwenhoekiella]|uniref:sulfatase family protein n=1 Tax=unclassified Leeuwenhoekiella TaxID=2615029 RepID=UPI000C56F3B5|nr:MULTISPECIES: arylsulfatase [unclassified Leeuwenhoekiella]MAW93863.1 arylsulfatase [Leeuwenhoekiella sp.]MBA82270.1 arylsulfatase [Leeuwenhoekiella sp.]|tara:strand:+ start:18554 stop:20134 length:1581 start_codon:yes stop_codon:yes gene_type:complete